MVLRMVLTNAWSVIRAHRDLDAAIARLVRVRVVGNERRVFARARDAEPRLGKARRRTAREVVTNGEGAPARKLAVRFVFAVGIRVTGDLDDRVRHHGLREQLLEDIRGIGRERGAAALERDAPVL